MILSLGEALIDRIHSPESTQAQVLVGGSPFNVSIALARLELDTGFLCPISEDSYGQMLADSLESNGVQRCVKERVSAPTAVAEVFTDPSGHPRYVFHREGSADRALEQCPPVEALPKKIEALHFGSLVLAQESDWPAWRAAIMKARTQGAFIAFDPNLRPALIDDLERHRDRLEEAINLAHLIKASDEDLSLLWPGCDPELRIQKWCSSKRVVVLTEGEKGSQLWTSNGHHVICRQTGEGPIADTVGAGDTFQAALIAWLFHHKAFAHALEQNQAQALLNFASNAASLNCAKTGCQPPTLNEVKHLLQAN